MQSVVQHYVLYEMHTKTSEKCLDKPKRKPYFSLSFGSEREGGMNEFCYSHPLRPIGLGGSLAL